MEQLNQLWLLVRKEILMEWRQKYAVGGILLYVFSSLFVVFFSFRDFSAIEVWKSVFWIIMLFASVNALTKSFVRESGSQQLYMYQLAPPNLVFLSKWIYNVLLLFVIGVLTLGGLTVLSSDPPMRYLGLFFLIIFLGSVGFALVFTFLSSISSKAGNSATLMAILSFPVVLPILLTLLNVSGHALGSQVDTAYYKDLVILLSIDVILGTLILILFPYLWRD